MRKITFNNLLWISILLLVSCSEDQIQTYNGPEAINLFVLNNQKQVNSAQLPLGFLDDNIVDSTVYLIANIQGTVVDHDRIITLQVPDSLKSADSIIFKFPKKVILPAGEYSVQFPLKVERQGLDSFSNGLNIVVQVKSNDEFIGGVYNYTTVVATNSMPTQWIGYTYWFPNRLGQCSKTKYRFVYKMLGFYDFTPIAYDYNTLDVYKNYLNVKLDEYEVQHGVRLWDPDLNKNVSFP